MAWLPPLTVPSGRRYMREFGFIIPERPVVVDDVRVRGTGSSSLRLEDVPKAHSGPPRVDKVSDPTCAHPPAHPPTHSHWDVRTGVEGESGRALGLEPCSPHTLLR